MVSMRQAMRTFRLLRIIAFGHAVVREPVRNGKAFDFLAEQEVMRVRTMFQPLLANREVDQDRNLPGLRDALAEGRVVARYHRARTLALARLGAAGRTGESIEDFTRLFIDSSIPKDDFAAA